MEQCTAQASGDNLLKVVPAFCDRLAHDPNATAPVSKADKPSVYFDFLAFYMVHKTLTIPKSSLRAPCDATSPSFVQMPVPDLMPDGMLRLNGW